MNDIAIMDRSLVELQNTQKLCHTLMATPHYAKIGREGIFAIVAMANAVGVDPLHALNGGMYSIKGKVEMSASLMNTLIRQAGHSVTKSRESNDTVCILHGKRADNGDTWAASFSIEDAKKAGIYSGNWLKYPGDMLFARALSRLGRQLFPDVLKGCYVQGEIEPANFSPVEEVGPVTIGDGAGQDLEDRLEAFPEYKAQVEGYMSRMGMTYSTLSALDAEKIGARVDALEAESE